MSYYDTLGLDESASEELIKRRYRELARKYHPDKVGKNREVEATRRFQEISVAYSVLQNKENRDRIKKLKSTSLFHAFVLKISNLTPSVVKFLLDIIQTGTITSSAALFFFTKKFSGRIIKSYGWDVPTLYKLLETLFEMSAEPRSIRDNDIEIEVSASLKSIYMCETRKIQFPRIRSCSCKGTGKLYICRDCSMGYSFDGICVKCSRTDLSPVECSECEGKGEKKEIKTFTISLGKQRHTFVEDGNHGKSAKFPGDLIFTVVPKQDDKVFKVWHEKHLVMVKHISLQELVNGFQTEIVLPSGTTKRLHIGGPIQPTCYKKERWGLPVNGDAERGDLFICCRLQCTDQDMELLRKTDGDTRETNVDIDDLSSYTLKTCNYAVSASISEDIISSNTPDNN